MIKDLVKTKKYKKQSLFVIFDCGPEFKKRYGVMGLTSLLFKHTKYFDDENEAIKYFDKLMDKFDQYTKPIGEYDERSELTCK